MCGKTSRFWNHRHDALVVMIMWKTGRFWHHRHDIWLFVINVWNWQVLTSAGMTVNEAFADLNISRSICAQNNFFCKFQKAGVNWPPVSPPISAFGIFCQPCWTLMQIMGSSIFPVDRKEFWRLIAWKAKADGNTQTDSMTRISIKNNSASSNINWHWG